MSSTRILLSFKDCSKEEREILKFLEEQGKVIGRGSYIKSLLYKEMLKQKK